MNKWLVIGATVLLVLTLAFISWKGYAIYDQSDSRHKERISELMGIPKDYFVIEVEDFMDEMKEDVERLSKAGFEISVGDCNQYVVYTPNEDVVVDFPMTKYRDRFYLFAIKKDGEWGYYVGPLKLPLL